MNNLNKKLFSGLLIITFFCTALGVANDAVAQRTRRSNQTKPSTRQRPATKERKSKKAMIRGKAIHVRKKDKKLVKLEEIKTSLHQQVNPPSVPVPRNWEQMKLEDQREWALKFKESDQGKRFLANREKMIKEAPVFEVIYEDDGSFTVYDVPPGTYGLQGRVDKDVDGTLHAFEVFAKIVVGQDVEILDLQPIPIVITPLFKSGQSAPPISVETYDGKDQLTLDTPSYRGKYLFLNFWFTGDEGQEYQKQVQKMYADLKSDYPIKLLSICVDEKRKEAIRFIVKAKYKLGSHGFTDGWDHDTVEAYGVRSTPSGWLIGPDQKIAMTQHEFYQAVKIKESITDVIRDRIDGKDKPTPATRPKDAQDNAAKAKDDPSRDKTANAGNRKN